MPKPILQALVLADHVYKDVFTGKMVIAGTFNRLFVGKPRPPAGTGDVSQPAEDAAHPSDSPRRLEWHEVSAVGSTAAYVSLTEVRGTVPLELRYVDLNDNRVLLRVDFAVKHDDPLGTVEAIIPIPPLLAPYVGVFALELLSDNETLGAHRVTVTAFPDSGPGQGSEGEKSG